MRPPGLHHAQAFRRGALLLGGERHPEGGQRRVERTVGRRPILGIGHLEGAGSMVALGTTQRDSPTIGRRTPMGSELPEDRRVDRAGVVSMARSFS
jgi:hypothetical protein